MTMWNEDFLSFIPLKTYENLPKVKWQSSSFYPSIWLLPLFIIYKLKKLVKKQRFIKSLLVSWDSIKYQFSDQQDLFELKQRAMKYRHLAVTRWTEPMSGCSEINHKGAIKDQ